MKPGATRMRTDRLNKTIGLHVYQITKTTIYKFKYWIKLFDRKILQNIIEL